MSTWNSVRKRARSRSMKAPFRRCRVVEWPAGLPRVQGAEVRHRRETGDGVYCGHGESPHSDNQGDKGILRFLSTSGVRVVLAAAQLLLAGGAFADEKTMPPLSGGVPMIEEIRMLEAGGAGPDFALKDTAGKLFDFGGGEGEAPPPLLLWSIFC